MRMRSTTGAKLAEAAASRSVVARLNHLGYQLEEGVRSEVVVGMAILHGSLAHPVRLAVMVSRRPKVSSDHKIIYFEIETFLSRRSFSPGRIG